MSGFEIRGLFLDSAVVEVVALAAAALAVVAAFSSESVLWHAVVWPFPFRVAFEPVPEIETFYKMFPHSMQ